MKDSGHSLGDAIREMIEAYGMKGKLTEANLLSSWEDVVGKMIAKHTKDLYIKRKKLFIKIDSPALKNELTYNRTALMEALNEAAGGQVIEEIVFL